MEEFIDYYDEGEGVSPTSALTLDPRQQKFMELYCDVQSKTFGNCYQSGIAAGFSHETARNLTHNRPHWYSEILGRMNIIEPELLVVKLLSIINDVNETTQNKLKAIDMLMKHKNMYQDRSRHTLEFKRISIESVLD